MSLPKGIASEIVVKISSNQTSSCPICRQAMIGADDRNFNQSSAHLLGHGLTCLHVGQETFEADGKIWQMTVAVFGK